jgi:O-antigen/teichoic acid export membrane protein
MYGARGVGLLWMLAITARLGIGEYGLYSMAFAVASILAITLNQPYGVRSVREPEEDFVRERCGRYLLGLALLVVGQAFLPVNFLAWFGLTVGGGELMMRSLLARAVREGHLDRSWKFDGARQVASVAMGCIYLFVVEQPTLLGACLLYAAPYFFAAVLTGYVVRGHRPQLPGSPKLIAALCGEMLGTTIYLQGDVLLLGWLTNTEVVGYYSITFVLASAVAVIGQSYGGTYAASLRENKGALSAGPPLRTTLTLGIAGGIAILLVGVGLLLAPVPHELAVAMMIMAGYCAMMTILMTFQAILYAQHRDRMRFAAAMAMVPVKFGALVALAPLGAVGAAIASTGTAAILMVIYSIALYRKPRR